MTYGFRLGRVTAPWAMSWAPTPLGALLASTAPA